MAIHDIVSRPEYGPFSAMVGTDSAYEQGHIRIEPPVTVGEHGLEVMEDNDLELKVRHFVTTDEATILSYFFGNIDSDANRRLSVLCEGLDFLLEVAAQAEAADNFIKEWEGFEL